LKTTFIFLQELYTVVMKIDIFVQIFTDHLFTNYNNLTLKFF